MMYFKISVVLHAVPPQHDATALCCRKKHGRPKKVSSALTIDTVQEVISIYDEDNDDEEDTKICGLQHGIAQVGGQGCWKDKMLN